MAQRLRVLTTLSEDPNPVSKTHIELFTTTVTPKFKN